MEAGLTPIVCVGETADQRNGGQETEVVGWQLAGSLPKPFTGVVAYEPIWAIGTGKTATAEDAAIMHAFIREELVRQFGDAGHTIRILYGGSVKAGPTAAVPARHPRCRRRPHRRRQPEGRRISNDCPRCQGRSKRLPAATGGFERHFSVIAAMPA